ncbi:MAG TPA: 50S ribosomal protein L9 [Desulfobulbus sp.]|nr:50S ribosomal protein L9 [Desulfobulbus sp.]
MEIILKKTIDTLGREGDIVNVKPGYARNYLIPKQMAVPVNKATLARLKREQQAIADRLAQEKKEAETMAAKLEGKVVDIARRVGEENRLFGSVTTSDIAGRLEEMGITVDRRAIVLTDPIKSIGESRVSVKVGYQMTAEITVQVVPENVGDQPVQNDEAVQEDQGDQQEEEQ